MGRSELKEGEEGKGSKNDKSIRFLSSKELLPTFLAPGSGLDFMLSGEIFDTSSVALLMISSTNFSATRLQISSETDGCLPPTPATIVTDGPFETGSLVFSKHIQLCLENYRWIGLEHTYTYEWELRGSCVEQNQIKYFSLPHRHFFPRLSKTYEKSAVFNSTTWQSTNNLYFPCFSLVFRAESEFWNTDSAVKLQERERRKVMLVSWKRLFPSCFSSTDNFLFFLPSLLLLLFFFKWNYIL